MPNKATPKHTPILYVGDRADIDVRVITADCTCPRVELQCSVCGCRFFCARTSIRNERALARKAHHSEGPAPSSSTTMATPTAHENSAKAHTPAVSDEALAIVVSSSGEGGRFLKDSKVYDVILSVQRQNSSDDMKSMLYAKTVDQRFHLLGEELPRAEGGYPRVMYGTGSTDTLEGALQRCRDRFNQDKARKERRTRHRQEEDEEWRKRVQAFRLICDPKQCPLVAECTTENLERCFWMLTDDLPPDRDRPIYRDGQLVGYPPRPGTHIPSHYLCEVPGSDSTCIMDHHPDGCADSPATLLPVLVDIVSKRMGTTHKECVFQLRDGKLVRTWVRLEEEDKRLFPNLRSLLHKEVQAVPFGRNEPFPAPQLLCPLVERIPLLTHNTQRLLLTQAAVGSAAAADGDMPAEPLLQFGLTALQTRIQPENHDDGGQEQLLELKKAILIDKGQECIEVTSIVAPNDQMLGPEVRAELHSRLEELEPTVRNLMTRTKSLNLRVAPRKLPNLRSATVEQLEGYQTCNQLHRSIVLLHARQGDRGNDVNLDGKGVSQLEAYWARLTR